MTALQQYRTINDMKIWAVKHLTIKNEKDKKTLYIRSCLILTSGQLLFSDENNRRLISYNKLNDGTYNRGKDINVSGRPFDMENVDYDKIAVSYGIGKYIEIINMEDKKVEKRIQLNGFCSGISYKDGVLLVLVFNVGVQKIDLNDESITTLVPTADKSLFITTSPHHIYFTDLQTNTLWCCDGEGKHLWKCKSRLLEGSQTVTADDYGNIFIAATQANQILAMSRDGQYIRKLVDDKQIRIMMPSAVYYEKSEKLLLICSRDTGRAFLYGLM